jgi:hypothetical protein
VPQAPTGKGISTLVSTGLFAYIDPGSGSVLLQALLGGVAALGVAAKVYWKRVRRLFGFGRNEEE